MPKPLKFRLSSLEEPPIYRIDLSLPPRQRHQEICRLYKDQITKLITIYDELLSLTPFPKLLAFVAKLVLRRVQSNEETEEIRGISEVTGVPVHLVVAYNTFLDLLSGCVSGGAVVSNAGEHGDMQGIVHFRNLDWEMEPLRKMMICVEYVRDKVVVARAVTYAGYTGALTGVRKGLSLSLNYRVRLQSNASLFSHRTHQIKMLLGRRPSIPSQLRQILLSPSPPPASLSELASTIPSQPSSTCFLTFCTPTEILILEKDFNTAVVHTSQSFMAVTNHDVSMEAWGADAWRSVLEKSGLVDQGGAPALIKDSIERKECITGLWEGAQTDAEVKVETVREWLEAVPLANETTHFSCIMDPSVDGGGLVWVRTYEEALELE